MAGFPEKILLVDDDAAILEIEELALSRVGDISVHACANCDEALNISKSFTPDIIILDLRMPGKNGADTIEEFRKVPTLKDVPVIFVTGEGRISMQDDYRQLGVLGVIHKPFKPSDLVMNIQKLWQEHRFSEK